MDGHLARITLFAGLDPALLARIARRTVWSNFAADRLLISQDEQSTHAYFLAEGAVRAKLFSSDGKEVSFSDFRAGDIFGEFAAIDEEPRASSVVTLTPVTVGRMQAAHFRELVQSSPEVAWRLVRLLVAKSRSLSERVAEFSVLAARQRIQYEILKMARKGEPNAGRIVIVDFPTHQELANRISSHREAVTRELSFLSAEKIITIRRGSVEVLDLGRLKQIARHFEFGRAGEE